jgi:ketosteroid isomerase-like protein
MTDNKEVIRRFYTAFQQRDFTAMNECYSENIVFSDPVFLLLEGDQVRAMWEMLCKNAKDLSLTFSDIQLLDDEYATCRWTATYTFSKTGRKVVNNAKAYMRLKDGKITGHSDGFRLSTWLSQALGWKGVLLGWTGWMKRQVQANAKKALAGFMEQRTN